jgi:hypothetical protein
MYVCVYVHVCKRQKESEGKKEETIVKVYREKKQKQMKYLVNER